MQQPQGAQTETEYGQPTGQQPMGQQPTGQQSMDQTPQLESGQPSQQSGGMSMQTTDLRLQDVESQQQWDAINDINRALQACEWCADQCIQESNPDMIECIRLCEDVSELGETALTFVPRQSRYAVTALEAFEQAAQACAQECSRHQASHCQDCAQTLDRAIDSVQQLVWEFQQGAATR